MWITAIMVNNEPLVKKPFLIIDILFYRNCSIITLKG